MDNIPQQENNQLQDQLPQEQQQPTDFSSSSQTKIFVGIGVAIIAVALSVGGYFFLKQFSLKNIEIEQQETLEGVAKTEVFLDAKKLLTFPEGKRGGIVNISEDLQHFAYSTEINGRKFLYANDKVIEGPIQNHFYTSDNKLVYTATEKDGEYMYADGEKIGGPYVAVRDFGFMPDGRIVYGAQRGEQWYFIVGEKEYGPYLSASDPDPIISPDGQSVAYDVLKDGSNEFYPEARYVINGKEESGGYHSVGRGVYSPDSKRFAYLASQADFKNDSAGAYVVLDGEKIGPYDDIRGNPEFSPDSKYLVFVAKKDKDWFIVLNSKEGKRHKTMPQLRTFSPDSNKFAYVVKQDKDSSIYINDEVAVTVTNGMVGELAFSQNAQKFAYSVEQQSGGDTVLISSDGKNSLYTSTPVTERKGFVVLNGEKGKVYDRVWGLRFSPDGEQFAYSAQDKDKQLIVLNGEEKDRYAIDRQAGSIFITFSPDNKHYMYVARTDDGASIVLDGKALGSLYDSVYSIKFSSDSKYLLYVYGLNNEVWYMPHQIK